MTGPTPHSQTAVRPLRGGGLLRAMHAVLPLGRQYHPLYSLFNPAHGLVAVPFGPFQLVQPAGWGKHNTKVLLTGAGMIPEFELLAPIVKQLERGSLIDVGANVGLYSLCLRSVSKLPIIAYEPQPFLFRLLNETIRHNTLTDVDARNLACDATRGEVPFHVGINGAVATGDAASKATASRPDGDWDQDARAVVEERPVVNVPVVPLDEDLAGVREIALLKIDCEGFEGGILQGAKQTIERHRPILFLEIHPTELPKFGSSVADVVNFLSPYYEMEFWSFEHDWPTTKLGQSLAKFKRRRGYHYPDLSAMLADTAQERQPSQVYCVGRPKR